MTFVFTGGFLGRRKPLEPVLEAWSLGQERARAARSSRRRSSARALPTREEAAARDARIELRIADEPTRQHLETVAAADVTLSPARWEGLGPAAVRGGRLRSACDHQRRRADERDHAARGERAPGAPRRPTARRARASRRTPSTPPRWPRRSTAWPRTTTLRADLSAGAAALREGERAWENTVRGFGSLLELAAP